MSIDSMLLPNDIQQTKDNSTNVSENGPKSSVMSIDSMLLPNDIQQTKDNSTNVSEKELNVLATDNIMISGNMQDIILNNYEEIVEMPKFHLKSLDPYDEKAFREQCQRATPEQLEYALKQCKSKRQSYLT